MSAFGIGINTQGTESGKIRGIQKEIACDCWFTSTGKTIPRLFKFIDDNGTVQTVSDIYIECTENKNYSGIPSIEHTCVVSCVNKVIRVKLIYFKDTSKWIMTYL